MITKLFASTEKVSSIGQGCDLIPTNLPLQTYSITELEYALATGIDLGMNFIDTHTHLFLKQFEDDIDDVIEIAIRSGITKMFLPNISSETTDSMLQLCEKYPEPFCNALT